MYELFTLGGGTYLVDLLNAVAAITSGGAYITLAQLAGVAGLAWVLFRTAFGGSWKDNAKWILLFVTVWGAMIVPKATVRVVDRLDPTLAPAVVANVPIGLALFASLTSQVGDGLTRLTEQAFTLPNDLQYQRHGLIFGARLAAKATRLEITDTVFARNVRNYARQCIFHALLLGHMSADDLRESTDIWSLVTAAGSPSAGASPARMFEFATRQSATGDGTAVADAGAATSRIPAAGVRLSESLATSHEQRAAEARTLSRHWSAEAGQARNAAVTDATAMIERYSHDVSTGEAFARGVTESESSQAQQLDSHVEKLSEIAGISKNQAAVLTGQAKVGGGWDFIVTVGADGSVMWRGQTIEQDAWNRVKEYDRQHGVTETWSQVAEASRRYSTQTGDSEMASLDESLSANLTRMRSFQERASLARQESESWSEQAAQVRSDAQAIERELGQPFFAWLSEQQGTDGRAIGAAGAMRIASPQTAEDSEQLREYAAQFIAEKYPAPAGPDPASVGGAAEYEGAAGQMRGAYGRETAAAYGGWSAGVRDRAREAGAPRPGEADLRAREERVETKTEQIMMGTAREARQTVTRDEAVEGRADIAAERGKPFERHATENLPVVGEWLAGNLFGTAKNAVPDAAPGGAGASRREQDERGWGDSSP